jgi:phosphatidate cytidylyltransferase
VSDLYDDDRPPAEGVRILGAEEARASLGTTRAASDTGADDDLDDDLETIDVDAAEPMIILDGEPQLDLREPAPRASAAFPDDEPVVVVGPRSEAATWSASSTDDLLPNPAPSGAAPVSPAPATPPTPPNPSLPNRGLLGESPMVRPGDLDDAPTGEVPPLPHWSEPATGAVPAIFADDSDPSEESESGWANVGNSQPRFRAEGSDWSESDFADDLTGENENLGALSNSGPVDEEAAFARDLAAKRGPKASATRTAKRRPPRVRTAPVRPEAAPAIDEEPAGPRDLPTAIMTGLAVAVVAITCFSLGEGTTVWLAAIIIGVATLEFASSLHKRGLRPATIVALVACTLMPLAARTYGSNAYPVFFAMVVIVSMLWFLLDITPGRPLPSVASTLLVFAYVGGLGGFAGLILASDNGVGILLGVALCVIAYDVFGFFVGSQFGRTPIAPNVSPNKSVEGTVAGMLAAIIVGAAVVGQFSPWNWKNGLVLGVLVAGGAFLGDLCESMLKRDLGLKDFGALLPGHGGVLDRFDSLLFCLPIAYYLAVYLKLW